METENTDGPAITPATPTPELAKKPTVPDQIDKLAGALAKAQGMFKAPAKTKKVDFQPKEGPRVKYNYADLADVLEAIREPLSKNALALFHQIEMADRDYRLVTTLMHESGQKISTVYPLPNPNTAKPQTFGGLLTYARRYSVSALVGIASDDDTDVQDLADLPDKAKPKITPAAAAKEPPTQMGQPVGVKNEAPASATQVKQISLLAGDRKISGAVMGSYMENCYRGVHSKNIKKWQAEEIIALLEDTSTNEATLMAAVTRTQNQQLSNQVNQ